MISSIPLVGYADRFSVAPGESIAFKVSASGSATYSARLVRVVSCDPNPDGPGVIEHALDSAFADDYPARQQSVHLGSYLHVPVGGALAGIESFTLAAMVWPTTPGEGRQGIIACGESVSLAIDDGCVVARVGDVAVATGKRLVERRWYQVWMSFDASAGTLTVGQMPLVPRFDADDAGSAVCEATAPSTLAAAETLLAAALPGPACHYNGKIERPLLAAAALDAASVVGVLAGGTHDSMVGCWDFSTHMHSPQVDDVGPHGLRGTLVNLPTRAVKGARWDASTFDWTTCPAHYAAVHFHDDDLYDAGWETDFTFTVPRGFRSGVYGVRLAAADGATDMIPFFVTPTPGEPQSRICVLIPTFTYTVYANIARGNTTDALREKAAAWNASPWSTDDHREFGLSTYNLHSDGSGIGYSSRRRPIITMRPAVLCYPDVPGSGLRHFAADGHLWYWLEHQGYRFDVITDDELHAQGVSALSGYDVVMTTTHPEYHTRETLDGLEDYTRAGGRFMYLGGNGFYWKVAKSEAWPDAVEIRRGEGGIRAWAAEPGEYYNAFDGTYGGLWRRNGRPPQMLCGVGFTAQGGHRGDAYRRTEASYRPEHAWIFAGVDDATIGDFGLSGGGAAGFELDRADAALGTPRNAVVLATSQGDGEHFVLVPEDILTNLLSANGEPFDQLVRADMVYFEVGGGENGSDGGAVFSVGSITFCGSLPVNDCDNNVSRVVANVLDRFLASRVSTGA